MSKSKFLKELEKYLKEQDVSRKLIKENIAYYDRYIDEEIAKGRSEKVVIAELGDPRIVGRSIVNRYGTGKKSSDASEVLSPKASKAEENGYKVVAPWKVFLALVIAVALIITVVFAIIKAVFYMIPVALLIVGGIWLYVNFFRKK